MPQIGFRPLAEADLPLLFAWLARPHVSRWYAPRPGSFVEVAAKYGPRTVPGSGVEAFVVQVDGADAGYAQTYRLERFPNYAALLGAEAEPSLAAMDLFLADPWRTGRGLGSFVIRRFFGEHVMADAGVTACIAGAHEGDAAAIRAFEKAGFRRWKLAANERGERECVLRRDRDLAQYRIAPIDLADADACVRMRREMYVASFGSEEGLDEALGPANERYLRQLRERIAELPEGNAHLWRDGEIVGQLEMRLLADDPEVLYLSLIHVAQAHRGHGHGKRLHAYAMDVAKRRGKRLMRLSVAQRNASAMLFYRRLGWVVVGTRPNVAPMAIMEVPVR